MAIILAVSGIGAALTSTCLRATHRQVYRECNQGRGMDSGPFRPFQSASVDFHADSAKTMAICSPTGLLESRSPDSAS